MLDFIIKKIFTSKDLIIEEILVPRDLYSLYGQLIADIELVKEGKMICIKKYCDLKIPELNVNDKDNINLATIGRFLYQYNYFKERDKERENECKFKCLEYLLLASSIMYCLIFYVVSIEDKVYWQQAVKFFLILSSIGMVAIRNYRDSHALNMPDDDIDCIYTSKDSFAIAVNKLFKNKVSMAQARAIIKSLKHPNKENNLNLNYDLFAEVLSYLELAFDTRDFKKKNNTASLFFDYALNKVENDSGKEEQKKCRF